MTLHHIFLYVFFRFIFLVDVPYMHLIFFLFQSKNKKRKKKKKKAKKNRLLQQQQQKEPEEAAENIQVEYVYQLQLWIILCHCWEVQMKSILWWLVFETIVDNWCYLCFQVCSGTTWAWSHWSKLLYLCQNLWCIQG